MSHVIKLNNSNWTIIRQTLSALYIEDRGISAIFYPKKSCLVLRNPVNGRFISLSVRC